MRNQKRRNFHEETGKSNRTQSGHRCGCTRNSRALLARIPSIRRICLIVIGAVATIATASHATTISVPFTFSNGTPADANEVNANFNVLVVESNAQDGRITAVESGLTAHEGDASAHHAKTTSFSELTLDQIVDGQIPASITRDAELTWGNLAGIPTGFLDGVDNDSGGTITAVSGGVGLTGSGTSGAVTLDIAVPLELSGPVGTINAVIKGESTLAGYGVHGKASGGHGVYGESQGSIGVVGQTTGGQYAVYGYNISNGTNGYLAGLEYGAYGQGYWATDIGVYGSNFTNGEFGYLGGNGYGVYGESATGYGVYSNGAAHVEGALEVVGNASVGGDMTVTGSVNATGVGLVLDCYNKQLGHTQAAMTNGPNLQIFAGAGTDTATAQHCGAGYSVLQSSCLSGGGSSTIQITQSGVHDGAGICTFYNSASSTIQVYTSARCCKGSW